VWLPARLAPAIREALDGYERGRQGPGQHTFAELLEATRSSLIRFEMRGSYDETEQGYAEWKATGDVSAYDWGDHLDVVRAANTAEYESGGYGWYPSRCRTTCGGSTLAPGPTSTPGKTSDGSPGPARPT
jgi:hypothetical protein